MIDLDGKLMLITGAGGGIGSATARMAAGLGCKVILHDIHSGAVEELERELGPEASVSLAADLADGTVIPELWRRALAWQGRIDILVNNAGIYEPAGVGDDFETWDRSWQRTLDVNLLAPAHLCREAILSFREAGGGIIINIASRAAFRGDDPEYGNYAASKGGILALTRTIARGFAKDNITAFAVAPGMVLTAMNDNYFARHGMDGVIDSIPLGEIAKPEDVARTIVFLASGHARHLTGQAFHINGASYVH